MVILTFVVVALAVAVYVAKRTLDKELNQAKKIYGNEYNLCELMLDKIEDMILGSSGAIFYTK